MIGLKRGTESFIFTVNTLPAYTPEITFKQPKWHIRSRISNLQRYEKINKGNFSLSLLYRFQMHFFPLFFLLLLGQAKVKNI